MTWMTNPICWDYNMLHISLSWGQETHSHWDTRIERLHLKNLSVARLVHRFDTESTIFDLTTLAHSDSHYRNYLSRGDIFFITGHLTSNSSFFRHLLPVSSLVFISSYSDKAGGLLTAGNQDLMTLLGQRCLGASCRESYFSF